MTWPLFIQLLATAFIAYTGAIFGHALSSKRDRTNKIRDQRINYLIDAYRKLEFSSNRHDAQNVNSVESAIADIQLFGSLKQTKLVREFATDFAKSNTASLDSLLEELRNDLRTELGLDPVPGKLLILRMQK